MRSQCTAVIAVACFVLACARGAHVPDVVASSGRADTTYQDLRLSLAHWTMTESNFLTSTAKQDDN